MASGTFLQVLKSWETSEGVSVCVHWDAPHLVFSFRGYVLESSNEELVFGTADDKGNLNMTLSLKGSKVIKMDKREIVLTFESGEKLILSGILQ